MNEQPRGYWTSVFYQATQLMRQKRGLDGDSAFLMARQLVDSNFFEDSASLPLFQGLAEPREALVLAP